MTRLELYSSPTGIKQPVFLVVMVGVCKYRNKYRAVVEYMKAQSKRGVFWVPGR